MNLKNNFNISFQLDEILSWFNKLMTNQQNHPDIYPAIKNFLAVFPQKVCAAIHHDATYDWKPYKSNYSLINVNIYREKFTDNLNVKNTILQRENIDDDAHTKEDGADPEIVYKLERKYGTWDCLPQYFPNGCNGYCMSEVHYKKELNYQVKEKLNSRKGSLNNLNIITDMYEIKFYNPEKPRFPPEMYDDMDEDDDVSQVKSLDRKFYRVRLPVLDGNVTANDHMRVSYFLVPFEMIFPT